MSRLTLICLAVLVGACSSNPRPVDLSRPVTAAASEALSCVRTELQQLGYTVEPTTGSNTVTGIRIKEAPWPLTWIGFSDSANQITATVEQGQLHVTAISGDPTNPVEGGLATTGTTANEETERHAENIVGSCS